jgi:hypothetical protein
MFGSIGFAGGQVMGGAKAVWMEEQERGWTSFRDKFACADCFEDDAIKALIHGNAESDECSYCGRASKSGPIAADMNCVMEDIFFGICQEWGDPNSEGVPYESAEGGWQGEVIDSWGPDPRLFAAGDTERRSPSRSVSVNRRPAMVSAQFLGILATERNGTRLAAVFQSHQARNPVPVPEAGPRPGF